LEKLQLFPRLIFGKAAAFFAKDVSAFWEKLQLFRKKIAPLWQESIQLLKNNVFSF